MALTQFFGLPSVFITLSPNPSDIPLALKLSFGENMTTEEIANAAYEKRHGLMNTLNPYDLSNQSLSVNNSMKSFSQMMLINEMSRQSDKIEQTNAKLDALIDKPVHQTFLDQLGAYETIVQKTTQGNKTVTKNKFLKG